MEWRELLLSPYPAKGYGRENEKKGETDSSLSLFCAATKGFPFAYAKGMPFVPFFREDRERKGEMSYIHFHLCGCRNYEEEEGVQYLSFQPCPSCRHRLKIFANVRYVGRVIVYNCSSCGEELIFSEDRACLPICDICSYAYNYEYCDSCHYYTRHGYCVACRGEACLVCGCNCYYVSTDNYRNYIRWLNCYGGITYRLYDPLRWELVSPHNNRREDACEGFDDEPHITHCFFGLIIRPKNIVRRYNCDVGSQHTDGGYLIPNEAHSARVHECFVRRESGGGHIQGFLFNFDFNNYYLGKKEKEEAIINNLEDFFKFLKKFKRFKAIKIYKKENKKISKIDLLTLREIFNIIVEKQRKEVKNYV